MWPRLALLLLVGVLSIAAAFQHIAIDNERRRTPRITDCEQCNWATLSNFPGSLDWCDCCRWCEDKTEACMSDNYFCQKPNRCSALKLCNDEPITQLMYDLDLKVLPPESEYVPETHAPTTTTTTTATTTTEATKQIQQSDDGVSNVEAGTACSAWKGFCVPRTQMCPSGAELVPQVPCNEAVGFEYVCCHWLGPQVLQSVEPEVETTTTTSTKAHTTTTAAATTTKQHTTTTTTTAAKTTTVAQLVSDEEVEVTQGFDGEDAPQNVIEEYPQITIQPDEQPQHVVVHDDDDSATSTSDHDNDDDDDASSSSGHDTDDDDTHHSDHDDDDDDDWFSSWSFWDKDDPNTLNFIGIIFLIVIVVLFCLLIIAAFLVLMGGFGGSDEGLEDLYVDEEEEGGGGEGDEELQRRRRRRSEITTPAESKYETSSKPYATRSTKNFFQTIAEANDKKHE